MVLRLMSVCPTVTGPGRSLCSRFWLILPTLTIPLAQLGSVGLRLLCIRISGMSLRPDGEHVIDEIRHGSPALTESCLDALGIVTDESDVQHKTRRLPPRQPSGKTVFPSTGNPPADGECGQLPRSFSTGPSTVPGTLPSANWSSSRYSFFRRMSSFFSSSRTVAAAGSS